MTNIYILRLKGGKFYVGKSDNPMKRWQEHLEGKGSAWTRKYKPVSVEKIIPNASDFDEDKYTKEMMAKHGIENVRGGAYVAESLDEIQEEALLRELWGAKNCCTKCGRPGHFIKDCYATTDVLGNELEYDSSSDEEVVYYSAPVKKRVEKKSEYFAPVIKKKIEKKCEPRYSNGCFRCGRQGHYSNNCYAISHVKGYYLDSDDD